MVEVTSRLEEYVCEGSARCPTLDDEVESLSDLETTVSDAQFDRELDLLSAVADPTRYRLLRILVASDERCVCELDAMMDVSDSAVSHALRRLVDAGLLTRRKEGRWRIYAATERAAMLVDALGEVTET